MPVAGALVLLWATTARAQAAGDGALEAGIAAYRAGDYAQARDQFRQAQAQGAASETLRFNLALSAYKLGDYPAARTAFESLRESPALAAAAEYHLGLVAGQSGQLERAAAHLRASQAIADSPELQQLAELALQRLAAIAGPRRLSATAALAAGYDSNRSQSSETAGFEDVEPEAAFAALSATARYPAGFGHGSELRGGLYLRDYAPDQTLDQTSVQLSLRQSSAAADWQFATAIETESVWLGGDSFLNAAGLNLDGAWTSGATTLSARYRPSRIAGGDTYQYLDGWSQRAELGLALAALRWRLRLGLDAELDDRRDLQRGDEFFSQSPLRHGVSARLIHRAAPRLTLDWSARYRHSRYADPNLMRIGLRLIEQRRVDELTQLGVAAAFPLGKGWGLRLDYRYSDNRSPVARYDYERHAVTLGLDWSL